MGKRALAFSLLLCLVLFVTSLASCGGSTPTSPTNPTAPTATAKAAWQPKTFVIVAGGMGTVEYACTCAIAPVMEKGLGIPSRALPMEIDRERLAAVREGTVQLTRSATNPSLEGRDVWSARTEGPQKLSAIWGWYDLPCGLGARGDDTSIMTIKDIKGKRINQAVYSPSTMELIDAIVAYAGYSHDDMIWVPFGSHTAATKALGEGKVDVGLAWPEGASTSEVMAMPHKLKWIDMPLSDTAAWQRFKAVYAEVYPRNAPEGIGFKEAWGMGMWSAPTWWNVATDANEELVYNTTKVLGDYYNDYKDLHIRFRLSQPTAESQRFWMNLAPAPYHTGAVRYMKEKGFWTAADDVWNKQLLDLQKQYQVAWQAALDEADAKQIKVDAGNKAWLDLWASYRTKLERISVRF